jgi:hypothetical protein
MSDDKAADVAFAHELLVRLDAPYLNELRDIIRRCIAGLSPEAADAALVELFREIKVLDEVMRAEESRGYVRNDDPDELPF